MTSEALLADLERNIDTFLEGPCSGQGIDREAWSRLAANLRRIAAAYANEERIPKSLAAHLFDLPTGLQDLRWLHNQDQSAEIDRTSAELLGLIQDIVTPSLDCID